MHCRKDQKEEGLPLPKKWVSDIKELLSETYSGQIRALDKEFTIHGFTYPDELFLAVGLNQKNDENAIPTTYIVSFDLSEKVKAEDAIQELVDSVGIFFDTYFSNPDHVEYITTWQEAEFKKIKFFYKVSRENIGLSILAGQLLNQ